MQLWFFLSMFILCFLYSICNVESSFSAQVTAGSGDYLIGVFGVPADTWKTLSDAGLNSALVREKELDAARILPLKKIYVLGVKPRNLKQGLELSSIRAMMERFSRSGDAYGFYLGDDINCSRKPGVDQVKSLMSGTFPAKPPYSMVGLISLKDLIGQEIMTVDCFRDYDFVFDYYYPLMRRSTMSLPDMLQAQTTIRNKLRSYDRRMLVFVQTHQPFWYKEVKELNRAGSSAFLYPDGQVVRMLIHYAVATGSNGYFLYDWESMSGEQSRERVLGANQAALELRPLFKTILQSKNVVYFNKESGVYGTNIKGDDFDMFFLFRGDVNSHYHPSTKSLDIKADDCIDVKQYQSVYIYSPTGLTPVSGKLGVPQDRALILIAYKAKPNNTELFRMDQVSLETYIDTLQKRSDVLTQNLRSMALTNLPALAPKSKDPQEKISALLAHIDALNEAKREAWSKKSVRMPTDGDILNEQYWKKQLNRPPKGDAFNFYYNEGR